MRSGDWQTQSLWGFWVESPGPAPSPGLDSGFLGIWFYNKLVQISRYESRSIQSGTKAISPSQTSSSPDSLHTDSTQLLLAFCVQKRYSLYAVIWKWHLRSLKNPKLLMVQVALTSKKRLVSLLVSDRTWSGSVSISVSSLEAFLRLNLANKWSNFEEIKSIAKISTC